MCNATIEVVGAIAQPSASSQILSGPPRHITPQHWLELTEGSGISPAMAAANFRSFGPDTGSHWELERADLVAHARLQIQTESMANNGHPQAQPGHLANRLITLQRRYAHLDAGGWRFLGDALPGHAPTPRWKPNQPRTDSRGRRVKYESQPGRRPGLLVPKVPITVWRLVAQRHGLPLPEDRSAGFWAWALTTPALRLYVEEGPKGACALLGQGLVAVALGGKDLGRVVERSLTGTRISEALIPELQELAPGRPITVCLDADHKPHRPVEQSAVRMGHLLAKAGAEVRLARLPLLGDGLDGPDDLLAAQGPEALEQTLADALALAEVAWERRYWAERRIRPTRSGIQPSELAEALQQTTCPIVGIRAPKGAGKTKAVGEVLANRPKVLAITHRRSLGAAMAGRLELVWRNDTDSAQGRTFDGKGNYWEGLPPRYCLCIDSLLAVRPDVYAGAVVVLDEAEQVLAHLISSATCSQNRGLLIQRLQQIIQLAGQVIALDADLSDVTINWLQQARGDRPAEVALLVGTGPQQSWPIHWYEQNRPDEAQAALLKAAAAGPVFVSTDSRERAAALHALLEHHLPQAEGLLVTSETTGQPKTQAWLQKLASLEALAAGAIRWVVASPSISSGLSIEHDYFHSVWGFYGAGTFDDSEALQALARIRPSVPRHVWVAPVVRPAKPPLSSGWWPQQVAAALRNRWDGQAAILRQQLQPDLLLARDASEAAEQAQQAAALWAELQSRRNYSLAHLRPFIKARLRAEGHHIVATTNELSAQEAAELKALSAELRNDRQQTHALAVANAPIIGRAEAERRRRLQQHSPALQRRLLVERLALEPEALTPELVLWGERWAGAAERLACLLEPGLAARLDLKRLKATTPDGYTPLPFDQSYRAQRSRAAELLGITAFIERFPLGGESWDKNTAEVVELAKLARDNRQQVEQVLGLKIRSNDTDTALVGALLLHFGITTTSKRIRADAPRKYGADRQQLQELEACSNRLRQKGSDLVPPSAEKGAALNKTTCGGTSPQQVPKSPWAAPAPWEQLPLSLAADRHLPGQSRKPLHNPGPCAIVPDKAKPLPIWMPLPSPPNLMQSG